MVSGGQLLLVGKDSSETTQEQAKERRARATEGRAKRMSSPSFVSLSA